MFEKFWIMQYCLVILFKIDLWFIWFPSELNAFQEGFVEFHFLQFTAKYARRFYTNIVMEQFWVWFQKLVYVAQDFVFWQDFLDISFDSLSCALAQISIFSRSEELCSPMRWYPSITSAYQCSKVAFASLGNVFTLKTRDPPLAMFLKFDWYPFPSNEN